MENFQESVTQLSSSYDENMTENFYIKLLKEENLEGCLKECDSFISKLIDSKDLPTHFWKKLRNNAQVGFIIEARKTPDCNFFDITKNDSNNHIEYTDYQAFFEIASELCDKTLIEKQLDYGPKNILKFGEFGCLVRASDKVERLKNLYNSDREPENENLLDSWKDLRNYGQIAVMVKENRFDLPLDNDAWPFNK